MSMRTATWILAGGLLAAAALAAETERLTTTVGLTAAAEGRTWAYILWQPTYYDDGGLPHVAVYRKAGDAASPHPYSRVSVTTRNYDPAIIATCVRRGVLVGDDPDTLAQALEAAFRDLAEGAAGLSLEEMISLVMAGAGQDPDDLQYLYLMARRHPIMALALGQAHVAEIDGPATFEIRRFDLPAFRDGPVFGRVTLDPAAPLVLPAPGAPVGLTDTTPTGDLNARLRWATPDPLRDLSLLQFGFNVYRVVKKQAEAYGWHLTPPTSAAMALLCEQQPHRARRVNLRPVLTEIDLDAAGALDPLDTDTFFLTDDNDRFQAGGSPFADGDQYYYFITARDLLGREGVFSPGTLVTICSRMPPLPPRAVRVDNLIAFSGGVRDQSLRVTWSPPEPDTGVPVDQYLVYRWDSINEIAELGRSLHPSNGLPYKNLVAIVPAHSPDGRHELIDDGTSAPPAWAESLSPVPLMGIHEGRTFYYTVRALDAAACGGNLSGNSAPAWGVLRDNVGPEEPIQGDVLTTRYEPAVEFAQHTFILWDEPNPAETLVLLEAVSSSREIEWIEFYEHNLGQVQFLGRRSFQGEPPNRVASLRRLRSRPLESSLLYSCRVGTRGGLVSDTAMSPYGVGHPPKEQADRLRFDASVEAVLSDQPHHQAKDPDDDSVNPPQGSFTTPPDSREWRLYVRVDNGPLMLIVAGTTVQGSVVVEWSDDAVPASYTSLCYYAQGFDEHGNPGSLWLIGCIESGATQDFPVPVLSPPVAGGTESNPLMRLRWLCPPHGVERFEVWIAVAGGGKLHDSGQSLSADLAQPPNTLPGHPDLSFAVFDTALARALQPGGGSVFQADVPVDANAAHTILVRAVGPGAYGARMTGDFSDAETFTWVVQHDPFSEDVPWPPRRLPESGGQFHSGIYPRFFDDEFPDDWRGVGICVGAALDEKNANPILFDPIPVVGFMVDTFTNPLDYVFRNESVAANEPPAPRRGSLMPLMLFRVQVANLKFPQVSGDLVQVTPLLEQIAYEERVLNHRDTVVIWDRHFALMPLALPATDSYRELYVLDRQPVLAGARYRYLIVRFGPDREIERVISAGQIEIPHGQP